MLANHTGSYKFYALLSILMGLLVSSSVFATPKIQSWQTENGAKVLFVEAPDLPMLDIRIVFDAGSARDGDKPGLSTLTNALLTEGAGDWNANQIAERMEDVGADLSSGSLRDMGFLSLRTLTEEKALNAAIETFSAILTKPTFPQSELDRLRQNLLVGLRQSEQSPASVGKKAMYKRLYGKHPYASDPSGTKASIKAITRDDIEAHYRRYYVAKNASVSIVGALSRKQAEQLATQVVGQLESGQIPSDLPGVTSPEAIGLQLIDFPSSQSHIFISQPGIRRGDKDYFALYVGNHILGGSGLVSLLSEEVREKRGLSYSVYSYFALMRQAGPFQMGLQTKNSQADEAMTVLMDTVRRFIKDGPTADQLTAAKQNITGGFPLRIASNSNIVEYLGMIGFYGLPLDYLDRFVGEIDAITAEMVHDAFQRRIHPDQFISVRVGPKAEAASQ